MADQKKVYENEPALHGIEQCDYMFIETRKV